MAPTAPESGFTAPAVAYARGRPGYPDALRRILRGPLGLRRGAAVVDVGAGTGKLTELLLEAGLQVTAVEPLDEMRARLEALGAPALAGQAEDLPVESASFEAVFAAQAFHWFDYQHALPEIHRVLRPAGHLCLIWNRRRLESRWQRDYAEAIAPYRGPAKTEDSVDWRTPLEASALFGPIHSDTLPHEQVVTLDAFLDRVKSLGYVARLPAGERDRAVAQIERIVTPEVERSGGRLTIPYETLVHWCAAR